MINRLINQSIRKMNTISRLKEINRPESSIGKHEADTQASAVSICIGLNTELCGLADNDRDDGGNVHQDHIAILQAELSAFRARKSEPLGSDPLLFWKHHSSSYPNLALHAAKLLCIPTTSLPCERLISVAGVIAVKRKTAQVQIKFKRYFV
jgi:hAT family C-terminal dimerisation region